MTTPRLRATTWYTANRQRIAALLAAHPGGLQIGPATYTAAHLGSLDQWVAEQDISATLEEAYVLRPLRMWREHLASAP